MTGAFIPRISAGLVLALLLAAASTASAQAPDPRWNDWLGCWNLVADGNVARLPPAATRFNSDQRGRSAAAS